MHKTSKFDKKTLLNLFISYPEAYTIIKCKLKLGFYKIGNFYNDFRKVKCINCLHFVSKKII